MGENSGGDIPTEAPGGIANSGIGFVQESMHKDAPPPPPATAAAYKKKSGESNSVIAMMDLLAKDLMGTEKYIASLHADCDWLVKYYEVRKEARADEIESLGKAKAVLNGADYSLLQRSH